MFRGTILSLAKWNRRQARVLPRAVRTVLEDLESRRLLSGVAGTLDPAFGTGGIVVSDLNGNSLDFSNAAVLQPDGKMVVAGSTKASVAGAPDAIAVARYTASGQLDTTFSGDGIFIQSLGLNSATVTALALDSSGNVIAVGNSDSKAFVMRLTSAGNLDTANFATGGILWQDLGNGRVPTSVATRPDGTILIGGNDDSVGYDSGDFVAQITPQGALDTNWGASGIIELPFSSTDTTTGIVVQPSGDVVFGAQTTDNINTWGQLCQIDPQGHLNTTFGNTTDGQVKVFTSVAPDINALSLDASGNILAAGAIYDSASGKFGMAVWRFAPDGVLDTTYASGGAYGAGVATIVDPTQDLVALGMAVDSAGQAVVTGSAQRVDSSSPFGLVIEVSTARFTGTGTRDDTFATGGLVLTNITGQDIGSGVGLTGDGRIVVGGTANVLTSADFMALRFGPASQPPVAHAAITSAANENSPITFDGSASTGDSLVYAWDFGSGYGPDSSSPTTTFTFPDSGTYNVSLRVTDTATSQSATDTLAVQVQNLPPVASISGPASVQQGASATFTLGATDPSPVDQAAGFTWNIDWNGDGIVDQTVSGQDGTQVSHVFATTGSFTIGVTATDKDGGTSALPATLPISITAPPSTPVFVDTNGNLIIPSTPGNDVFEVQNAPGGGLQVIYNGVLSAAFTNVTGQIIANGGAGDDRIIVDADVTVPAILTGGIGNDTLVGGAGNDSLVGGDGNDSLAGGAGNDTLNGGAGNDTSDGGDGNDLISNAGDNDLLLGGAGNDTLNCGAGNDIAQGQDGNDLLIGGTGDDSLDGGAGDDTLTGGTGNDTLDGGSGNNSLSGGDGNDSLIATSGNNTIGGGAGDDIILVGDGNNYLTGGEGNDSITAGNGSNTIGGGAGNDTVVVGNGNNAISGGAGNDSLVGGAGNDTIAGGDGDDTIFGGAGNDSLGGNAGNDIIVGGAGNDTITGGADRDLLIGGTGADNIAGNAEDDILVAGSTSHDADPAALAAIMAEWTSDHSYADRVNNLINGGGAVTGLNGSVYLNPSGPAATVFDDGAVDTLAGNSGTDLYYFNKDTGVKDIVSPAQPGEIMLDIN